MRETRMSEDTPVILDCGQGWLAAEKPADVSVHNQPGQDLCSLLASRIEADRILAKALGWEGSLGLQPVHRLDKATSGVMLLACQPETLRFLAAQFSARQIHKRYRALVHGRLENPKDSAGWLNWQWPLSREAGGRRDPAGSKPRKVCLTRYRTLALSVHYSMLECEPVTGRRHQIRRHACLAGHPVVGDGRYGSRRAQRFLQTRCGFHRLALHAAELTFTAPGDGRPRTVKSATLPPAMALLFQADQPDRALENRSPRTSRNITPVCRPDKPTK
jgi:23S rRNA-/tRNA-specific pseudouridylate synthase